MKIAMWSGPRNLSTAMMYSFGARSDTAVWDEPFYAAYLKATGLDHPMRKEIMDAGEQDSDRVAEQLLEPAPNGKTVFYQKHMTQHMIDGFSRDWFSSVTHVFLIRHPARVIASYGAKRENPSLDDIGFRQQAEIFDQICEMTGSIPPVLDSFDIRADPKTALEKLCVKFDLPFQQSMLHWPKGGHSSDGAWAPHWYGAVWKSTGFADPEGPLPKITDDLQSVLEAAQPYYDRLVGHKL